MTYGERAWPAARTALRPDTAHHVPRGAHMSRIARFVAAAACAFLLIGGAAATASADSGWGPVAPMDSGWGR